MADTTTVTELIGIYDATWDLRGALNYVSDKAHGEPDCALCRVTHSSILPKREWKDLVAGLGVPFPILCKNQLPTDIETARQGLAPCVLIRTDDGVSLLLRPEQIAEADGDVASFGEVLHAAIDAAGVALPAT